MKGKKTLLIILAAVLVVAAAVAALLFMPRTVKLDDLTVPANPVSCLVKFGVPDEVKNGMWIYYDLPFYDETMMSFSANIDDTSHGHYFIIAEAHDYFLITDELRHYGEVELGQYFDTYFYENIEISAMRPSSAESCGTFNVKVWDD